MGWPSGRRRKNYAKLEDGFFIENGNFLLKEMIKSCDRKQNPIQIFSKSELENATHNYNRDQIFHYEGHYNLYKGWYKDENILVMKYIEYPYHTKCEIINEIVIASEMSNHENMLRLLGCCLETEFPVLVYEFASNGNLCDYIVKKPAREVEVLSWETRLRIAIEIGYAIAYLHMSKSSPIIHRGIQPSNIFLDQNYVAKLSGFTFSLPIPQGEIHVEASIAGTFGYVDPECLGSGRFTTKSDVYGFGVVLLEMITGKRIMDIDTEISEQMISGKDEEIDKIVTICQAREERFNGSKLIQGNVEQLMACSQLAFRCLKENSAERPEMKEVVQELKRIEKVQPTSCVQDGDFTSSIREGKSSR